MPYRDLREYLNVLEEKGLLCHVTAEVDKDWEISAVCRQTFRTIPQERRPARLRGVLASDQSTGPLTSTAFARMREDRASTCWLNQHKEFVGNMISDTEVGNISGAPGQV